MDDYLDEVIENLTLEDLKVLGELYDKCAFNKFKGLTNKKLSDSTYLTKNAYSSTTNRLFGKCFIDKATDFKTHRIYITNYGVYALERSLKIKEGVDLH